MTLLHALGDPWTGAIMQRALLEVVLLGAVGGALGCWIVVTGLAYGAESLAHGMFPGLVLAALTGIPLLLGGAAGLLVAALAIAAARRAPGIDAEVAIAVVVTTLFGLGALLALSPDAPPGIQTLLFGDVLGTSGADLLLGGALVALVLGAMRLLHWRLLAVAFDRAGARALGASTAVADVALLVLLAAAVLVAVPGLGNLLVVAALVAPAAAARRLARRMGAMIAWAVAIAVLAGIAGLYLSYYADVAAGAAIAGAMVASYALARAAALARGVR